MNVRSFFTKKEGTHKKDECYVDYTPIFTGIAGSHDAGGLFQESQDSRTHAHAGTCCHGGADAGATPDTSGAAFQHPMLKNSLSTEPQGYAVGLDYVPYDNFPALLHQVERVLTANEARAQDRESGRQIVVNISGEWHVRSDADVDAIAGALADKLLLAQMAG